MKQKENVKEEVKEEAGEKQQKNNFAQGSIVVNILKPVFNNDSRFFFLFISNFPIERHPFFLFILIIL